MKINTSNKNKNKWIIIRLSTIVVLLYSAAAFHITQFTNENYDIIDSNLSSVSNHIADIAKSKLIARKYRPVYINLPGADEIRAIVDDYEDPGSIWKLVNKSHSLPLDYIPENISIPDVATRTDNTIEGRSVRNDIADDLKKMFNEASTYSYQLMVGSAYRPASVQQSIYDYAVSVDGFETASKFVAVPGHSEHQSALAVDITTVSRTCYIDACFADTSDGQWLAQNSYRFGFILRYPKGKEDITGYNYEPWHFRYVGVDLATALYQSNLTLEEAYPYITEALTTLKKNGSV